MTDESKVETKRKPGKPKGSAKTGGRKKGTPNKNSSRIRDALDQLQFNVIAEFVKGYQSLEPDKRLTEIKYLMKFLYPQLSEVAFIPEHGVNPSKANESTAKLLSMVSGGKS